MKLLYVFSEPEVLFYNSKNSSSGHILLFLLLSNTGHHLCQVMFGAAAVTLLPPAGVWVLSKTHFHYRHLVSSH